MTIRSLKEVRNKKCKACHLHKKAEFVCLPGYGSDKARIMMIGEAPGHREDESGRPFQGKAGRILDVILDELGLSRNKLYISNICKCRPPDNRTPKMDEMRACREYLDEEIKIVKPKIIVCLGNVAIKGLFDTNAIGIKAERGNILDYNGTPVIPTYHPSAANYNKYMAKLIYQDLEQGLNRVKDWNPKASSNMEKNYIDVNKSNLKQVKKELMDSKVIVADIESEGLDMFDKTKEMLYVGLTNRAGTGWIFPTEEKYLDAIDDILNSADLVANHNIKFDLKWLLSYNIKVRRRIFCTQTALHLLDENYPDKSLEHLAKKELSMEMAQYMNKWKKATKGKWERGEPLRNRNGGDIDATFQLYEIYSKALKEQGLEDLMRFEMRNLKVLTYMEYQGVRIDQKNLKLLRNRYRGKLSTLEGELKKWLGDININSPQQLGKRLYGKLKLPILKETPEGDPSTDEATLQELSRMRLGKGMKKLMETLLEYRGTGKLYNTYIAGLSSKGLLKSDGRVHPNFKIFGTVTGRLSCTKPNLQQIPREGDIKLMFTSGFKSGVLIQGDYSQAELRILAHYSNCSALIAAFKSGRDIHQEVAAKVFKKPYDKVTVQERKSTKRVNFGIIYLISVKGLAEKLNCSEARARKLINDWFEEFPEAKKWINKTKNRVITDGYIENIFGRRRRFFATDPSTAKGREDQRQGVNSPIQGGAGDLTKWVGSELHYKMKKRGLESKVIINVHDCIMVDSPKKEARVVSKMMKRIAENPPIKLKVPLKLDIKIGPNWGSLKEIK